MPCFQTHVKAVITSYFIRTDCPQYRVYEHGAFTGSVKSLKEYSEQLKDMVTFYLGCSFSFEKAIQNAGIPVRNVEQECNVSMYKVSRYTYSLCCNFFHICPYSSYGHITIVQNQNFFFPLAE